MVTQTQEDCCTCLAIASVPMQKWRQPLNPEIAFVSGTIFAQLVLPYSPPTGKPLGKQLVEVTR